MASAADDPSWAWEMSMIGGLHPLLVHLPIGLCVGLVALECAGERHRPSTRLLTLLAASGALLSAVSGWGLAEDASYAADHLLRHRVLGLATAVGLSVAAVLCLRPQRRPYRVVLAVTALLLISAGHTGGILTHGPSAFDHAIGLAAAEPPRPAPAPAPAPAHGVDYGRDVAPILAARCVECHGPSKRKGALRLDTVEHITAGGSEGPTVIAGDPERSALLVRVRLPEHEDGHMPPKGDPLTAKQIATLDAWVRSLSSASAPAAR
jgi:mono/diheme cytochrome c family protein